MSNTTKLSDGKDFSTRKKILFSITTLIIMLVVITIIGEIYTRKTMGEVYKKPDIPPPYNTAQTDDYLGWKMTPNYSFDGKMQDKKGEEYDITIRYDDNGFKTFGDVKSTLPKVFFIGDSYTSCIEVSNKNSFYNIIKDSINIEVFAYGHAGFGTLQEYLVLDKWIDQINPDLIVWETCSNDFIDNCAELEIECGYKVGERRPYLNEQNEVFYRTPKTLWQKIKTHVYFYRWLDERAKLAIQKSTGEEPHVGEFYIATQKREYPLFEKSINITERILEMAKKRINEPSKIIGFSADNFEPQMSEFERIFQKTGYKYATEPAKKIAEKEYLGETVKSNDGYHWNENGHMAIAHELIPYITKALDKN